MSLHDNISLTLPKNYTRLNVQTSIGSGSRLYSVRNEQDVQPSVKSDKTPEKPRTSFSVFGEESCGEPQTAQHLVIDFTHNEEDNDFVQKKCCAFWKFVEGHPEIHHLMDSQMYPSTPTASEGTSMGSPEKTTKVAIDTPVVKDHTAVSMLDFAGREGLINKSFEAKMPKSFCPLGSREYLGNQTTARVPKPRKRKLPAVCRCGGKCNTCSKIPAEQEMVTQSSEEVRDMCENLKEWDLHHPQSMEPPGRAVPLIHYAMQRKVS